MQLALLLAGLGYQSLLPLSIPEPPREMRGAWVATVDNIDWPRKKGTNTEALKAELDDIVSSAADLKLNTLIFQVRTIGDALYPSSLEPWGEWISGSQGKPPSPEFDPLAYLIHSAHWRGIEVHAWFNPYRAWHPSAESYPAANHVSQAHPDWVRTYGKFKWMDPGEPQVADWTLRVMDDVVTRYDLDGLHIDDYFYPYPIAGQDFPDVKTYAAYQAKGGKLGKHDWRRSNTDEFVRAMYAMVHRKKPWVKVGISPFGIYRPGIPDGIQAGVDQYDGLYADCKKWLAEGWCDYMVPQLYWKISQTHQAYPTLLNWWTGQNPKKRVLAMGNASYQVEEAGWQASEMIDQVGMTRKSTASGNVFFSFKNLQQNVKGLKTLLQKGVYADPAISPSMPWLKGESLPSPKLSVLDKGDQWMALFDVDKQTLPKVRQWAVWMRMGDKWSFRLEPTLPGGIVIPKKDVSAIAVAPLDRLAERGPWAVWRIPATSAKTF